MTRVVDRFQEIFTNVNHQTMYIKDYIDADSTNEEVLKGTIRAIKDVTLTPNFFKLRKAGAILPMNPYYVELTRNNCPHPHQIADCMETVYFYGDSGVTDQGDFWEGPPRVLWKNGNAYWRAAWTPMTMPDLNPFLEESRKKASTKLLLAIKETNFNAAIAYAESGKLNTQVRVFVTKLATTLRFLRKGELLNAGQEWGLAVERRKATRYRRAMSRAKDPASIENTLASGVLAIQYGLRPAMNDIYGACELAAQKAASARTFVKKGHAVFLNEAKHLSFSSTYNAYLPYRVSARSATTGFVRTDYSVIYSQTEAGLLHAAAQLGLTNPLSVVWEVLPWSHVIDWVIPVGNALATLDAVLGLSFGSGCMTQTVDVKHVRFQAVTGGVETAGSDSVTTKWSRRTILKDFPLPTFPTVKNPASLEHALNGIAQLQTLRRSLVKA